MSPQLELFLNFGHFDLPTGNLSEVREKNVEPIVRNKDIQIVKSFTEYFMRNRTKTADVSYGVKNIQLDKRRKSTDYRNLNVIAPTTI